MEDSKYNFIFHWGIDFTSEIPFFCLFVFGEDNACFFHSLSPVVHIVVHFWFLFWLTMLWIHCHHYRQESPGCDGGGATGLIVMTYALPQSDSVFGLTLSRNCFLNVNLS